MCKNATIKHIDTPRIALINIDGVALCHIDSPAMFGADPRPFFALGAVRQNPERDAATPRVTGRRLVGCRVASQNASVRGHHLAANDFS